MGAFRFLYRNKSFIILSFFTYLILWFTISALKQTSDIQTTPKTKELHSTFYPILKHLLTFNLKLILIDPHVLKHLFIDHLSFDHIDRQLITFGVIDQSIENYFQSLKEQGFSIKTSTNVVLDHVFIEYKERIIHLAILHPYHSFYLIQPNRISLLDHIELSYGDKLRAFERVQTDSYNSLFIYPRDVSHFLWLYETSEFLHCNRLLADQMESQFHLYQNESLFNITVIPMRNIARGLDKLEKRYWLAGGTLLGWYRHCGLIPYTQDADFGLFAEEYDESIRNWFLGNPITYLWGALGLVNDSLEFRLYTGKYTLDLFWAYREGDHRWCGYQVNRAKFRRTLPLLPKLCSCDLFGFRFTIPCQPVEYLDGEYGTNKWQSPLEKNYIWVNTKYHSVWDDISWMYATRLYTREGKLRTDKFAIEWISKHFNYSITSIPSFINALPDQPVTLPPLKTELVYGTLVKKKRVSKTT